MPVVTVGKTLRAKLGEKGVEELVELLNQAQNDQKANILQIVEEKFERRLSSELSQLKTELIERMEAIRTQTLQRDEEIRSDLLRRMEEIRTELIQRIEVAKTELIQRMEAQRTELIKWMFIFWIGQMGFILGILFTFFKR
ncbi:MAG: hypothetical protein GXO78_02475 [Calditrichaeota bacterium]|nr:hypothetical protein [Calditrichota bacterium]